MQGWMHDLRYAVRSIRKNPRFSAGLIATLALGIGANTILYSVVDGLILNPYPFPDADELVAVGTEYPRLGTGLNFIEHISPAEYVDIAQQSRSLERVVAWDMGNRQVSFGDLNDNLFTGFWWGDGLRTLGMNAHLGRGLTEEETRSGAPVAVISHRVWQSRLGADPDIIGTTFGLNGNPYEVVGVMPPQAEIAGMDLWIPMGVDPSVFPRSRRQFQVMARIRDGFDMEAVNVELETLARRTQLEYGQEFEEYEGWRLSASTFTHATVRSLKPAGMIVLGAVGFVLLLVCSNVASLLLARASARRQEMAVRVAMGAGRRRIVQQVLTESVLLAGAGGALGLLIAQVGTQAAADVLATVPFLAGSVALNGRVLAFAAAVSLGAGLLFGLLPALQSASGGVQDTLKSGARGTTGGRGLLRLQRWMVGVEVAVALVLLVGGGLLVSSLVRLASVDPGFEPEGVITLRLTLPWEQYQAEQIGAFFQTLEEEVAAIPGVEAVGRGDQFPPVAFAFRRVATPQMTATDEGQLPVAITTLTSPGYFTALRMPLVRGRLFGADDRAGAPLVAIVNQAAADLLFEGQDPLGQRVRAGSTEDDPWFEVVGVVGNTVNVGPDQPPMAQVFANHVQVPGWSNQMFLTVRAGVEPHSIVPAIRAVVQRLDADQPVYMVRTVPEVLARSVAPQRIAANVLTVFAGFALFLAALGIFAVVSFSVSARTREIGLRKALGAREAGVRRMVVRQSLLPVALGAAVGLGLSLILGRFMGRVLFQVSATDPVTLGAVLLILGAVALVASYIPARRASRLDPVQALRFD